MNRRTIPFGYKFENGQITVDEATAEIVKEIFARYISGESMLNISALLNRLHVEYSPGIVGWNKARIKRILENQHYIGDEKGTATIKKTSTRMLQSIILMRTQSARVAAPL